MGKPTPKAFSTQKSYENSSSKGDALPTGRVELRVDGPQRNCTIGALGIDERREGMLAEDRTQFTCLRLVTAMQQGSLGGGHGCTQIAIALVLQEQIDGSVANAQNFLESALRSKSYKEVPSRTASSILSVSLFARVTRISPLPTLARRCDDHATASMRVVWLHPPA